MCRSMVDIKSPTAEIRRGKKERRNRMKIYMVSPLLHRATIKEEEEGKKLQDENIMVCPIT